MISQTIKKFNELFQTDNFSISIILFDFIICSSVIIQVHKYQSIFIFLLFNSSKKFQVNSSRFLLLADILSKVLTEIHLILVYFFSFNSIKISLKRFIIQSSVSKNLILGIGEIRCPSSKFNSCSICGRSFSCFSIFFFSSNI
jgi:hypothetical protein